MLAIAGMFATIWTPETAALQQRCQASKMSPLFINLIKNEKLGNINPWPSSIRIFFFVEKLSK
jgi:hypothetical protein